MKPIPVLCVSFRLFLATEPSVRTNVFVSTLLDQRGNSYFNSGFEFCGFGVLSRQLHTHAWLIGRCLHRVWYLTRRKLDCSEVFRNSLRSRGCQIMEQPLALLIKFTPYRLHPLRAIGSGDINLGIQPAIDSNSSL